MCQMIFLKTRIKEEDATEIFKRAEELGFGGDVYKGGIELDLFQGSCFCTPKDGWREALKELVSEVIGETYYIVRKTDIYIYDGVIPQELIDEFYNYKEQLQEQLNLVAKRPSVDLVNIKALEDAILNYKYQLRMFRDTTIDELKL